MNLLDTGVNHPHTGQPRQTHPPVSTVDASVLSRFIISYLEPKRPVSWLELGPCFGEWDGFKIVDIQRFLTRPTPNLSNPTASLSGLLCGLCKSQMSRFPIFPIWLKTWLVMWMSHAWKTKAKVPTSTHTFMKEKWHLEHLPGLGNLKQQTLIPGTCHMPHTWLDICIDPAKLKQSENTPKRNAVHRNAQQELPKSLEHVRDRIADLS